MPSEDDTSLLAKAIADGTIRIIDPVDTTTPTTNGSPANADLTLTSQPISPQRFRAALSSLPLSSLHAKAAEITNSIRHMQASNTQLEEFAATDEDCAEAIRENAVVLTRFEERLALLKEEVEKRGMRWVDGPVRVLSRGDGAVVNGEATTNGDAHVAPARQQSGSLTDAELERRLREQMGEDDEEEEGVHL